MNEDCTQKMIELLEEISEKITLISNKIATEYDTNSLSAILDHIDTKLKKIESNTSS